MAGSLFCGVAMGWIGVFPVLLLVTLAVVFQPLYSRHGHRPLPRSLEGDPWAEWGRQRDRLLRQLKEWQLEEGGDAAVRAGLEQELAVVLGQLDRLGVAPAADGGESRTTGGVRSGADMGFGAAVIVVLAVLAGTLYIGMGKPMGSAGVAARQPGQEALRAAVDGLAQRLEKEPDNLDGWLKLARSQIMMDNIPAAMRAYAHVLSRQADHLEATVGLAELQVQSGEEEESRRGLATLEGVLVKHPDRPEALWLIGAMAARSGDPARAVDLWQRLLPLLPVGSEPRATVEAAIREARSQMPAR
ncbi:MAG: hypothetical protein H7838_08380 [Magnetococcus sp. DMHC-8]